MKKLLSLVLAVLMVVSLFAACGKEPTPTTTGNPNVDPTDPNVEQPTNPPVNQKFPLVDKYTVKYGEVNAGAITMTPGTSEGGEVSYDVFAGVAGKDYTDPAVYTMNDYMAGNANMVWDPLNWETSDDSYVLGYISDSLVTYALNATADGWAVEFSMATGYEDVTSEYVGQFGIVEGDYGKAWKFTLNPNACWQDGTPINADTFIYSAKEQLSPLMNNRRADSLYAGDAAIVGAKAYYYQGKTVKNENATSSEAFTYAVADLVKGDDGNYYTAEGKAVYVAVGAALANWLGGNSLAAYVNAYGEAYFGMTHWESLVAAADANGFAPLNDDTLAWLTDVISANPAWGETADNVPFYLYYDAVYGDYAWEDVGIIKTGEYEMVWFTEQPIDNSNYYVPYYLGGTALVYESLWESCKKFYDADGNSVAADSDKIASISTNYGTSLETTMSYGPYKLSYFELDKQITFERNEKWYGYHDGKHLGQYQTDVISCAVIAEHETSMLAFLNGEIDSVSLRQEDMPKYGTSEYIRYNPQTYTTKLSFNTNFDSLYARGTGSQVLVNRNFRTAFSLALNTVEFASSFTTGSAGYGLLNYLYVYDPFSGATYRDTDAAKAALVDLYGLTYGADGDYEDLEEAYEAITGYDPDTAKELMKKAFEECTTEGLYDGVSNIELQINVYNSDDIYVQMVNYFQKCLDEVTAGTGFEGKVKMKLVTDADYYDTMYSGNTDIIFTTWGGAAYSPYTMLYQCYCDGADGSGQQMEYGFDTTQIPVTININGEDFTSDLQTWAKWACGYLADDGVVITGKNGTVLDGFNTYDALSRAAAFAKLEYVYLSYYPTTPLYYRASAVLLSQQGDYAVKSYLDLIGFGGIQFYTYNYNDAEWDAVKGSLTY